MNSDSFLSTSMIVLVVWIALVIDSFINYFIGLYFSKHRLKSSYVDKSFLEKGLKISDLLYLFHTTSIAYFCFNLGFSRRSVFNLIYVNLFVLGVCIFYTFLILVFTGLL